jgi:hypothetical protein
MVIELIDAVVTNLAVAGFWRLVEMEFIPIIIN